MPSEKRLARISNGDGDGDGDDYSKIQRWEQRKKRLTKQRNRTHGRRTTFTTFSQWKKIPAPTLLEVAFISAWNFIFIFIVMGIRIRYINNENTGMLSAENPEAFSCTVVSSVFFLNGIAQMWYFIFQGKQTLERSEKFQP